MTSSLVRRNQLGEAMPLQKAMERLMEDVFMPDPVEGGAIALDVYETEDAVVLKATLAGVAPEDLEVTTLGREITIKGEIKAEKMVEGKRYVLRERREGMFRRTVALPENVLLDEATAEFQHGVLTLTVPKTEDTTVKTISVNTA